MGHHPKYGTCGKFGPERLAAMPDRAIRLGIIYPCSGTRDSDFWRFAPKSASIHITRLAFESVGTRDAVREMSSNEHLREAAVLLSAVDPAAIAWADTSGSFLFGPSGDAEQVALLSEVGGVSATTTSTAIIAACEAAQIRVVDIASPYLPELNEGLSAFLEAHDVRVGRVRALETKNSYEIASVSEAEQSELIRSAAGVGEAVLVPCTDFLTTHLIPKLEQALNRLVIGANPVTMWHLAHLVGAHRARSGDRLGRLFAMSHPPSSPSLRSQPANAAS